MKKKAIWLCKLSILTFAIYWFISDGFTATVSETFYIESNNSYKNEYMMYIMIGVVIIYIVFMIIRSLYQRYISKPKSETYKKYREMKE